MAKLPAYLELIPRQTNDQSIGYTLKIKRWGIPILVFQTMRERFDLRWYQWLMFPYFCIKGLFLINVGDD